MGPVLVEVVLMGVVVKAVVLEGVVLLGVVLLGVVLTGVVLMEEVLMAWCGLPAGPSPRCATRQTGSRSWLEVSPGLCASTT